LTVVSRERMIVKDLPTDRSRVMGLRRLSGQCEDIETCPGVWEADQYPDDVIVVGELLEPSPVPLGPGEGAVRLSRHVVCDAKVA
jgi:hypothetical protein